MRLAAILIALALAVPGVASAETRIPLHTGPDSATFFDRDSRAAAGANTRITALEVYRQPKPLLGRPTSAWIRTYEVDCTSRMFQVAKIHGLTATGEPVPGGIPEPKWQATANDTPAWAVVELVCGRDKRFSASTKGLDKMAVLKRPIQPYKAKAGAAQTAGLPLVGESWMSVNYGDRVRIFADPGSRKQDGSVWEMADLRVFGRPVTIGGTPARVWIVRAGYDCASRTLRTISYEALDDAGGRKGQIPAGKVVWEPIKPGTDGETLLKIGCGERKPFSRTPLSRTQAIADGLTAFAPEP